MLQLGNIKMLNSMSQDILKISQRMADPWIKATIGARQPSTVPEVLVFHRLPAGEGRGRSADAGGAVPRHPEERPATTTTSSSSSRRTWTPSQRARQRASTAFRARRPRDVGRVLLAPSEVEYVEPLLKDLFFMELRAGRLGAPPRSAQGRQMRINFVGPLWQMQRARVARRLPQHLEAVQGVALPSDHGVSECPERPCCVSSACSASATDQFTGAARRAPAAPGIETMTELMERRLQRTLRRCRLT